MCTPAPPHSPRLGFTTALRTAGGRRRAGLAPGAGQQITAYLGTARRSVEFTSEELADPHVVAALVVGARRRAGCQLVMTASAQWAAVFAAVTRAGCTLRTYPYVTKALYLHGKHSDRRRLNADRLAKRHQHTSVNGNRELSVTVTAPALVEAAAAIFAADYRTAQPWTK